MRRRIQVLSIVFVWLALTASAYADKRVALVIGNADYQSVPQLGNPIKDAAAMAAALQRLGFTVQSATDVGFDALRRALKDFAGASTGADIAVIYYAGHGMEIGGENYLVPVDAKLATDGDVPFEAISLELALGAVEGARGTRLIILDACRNNPFTARMKVGAKSRSIGRGLARVEPEVGTIVAYSAKEGTTAEDGDADHSPFTKALLQHIEEPGIDVQFLLREVRDTVLEQTNGKQEPFTYGSLPGKAVLLSSPKEVTALPKEFAPPPPPRPAVLDTSNDIAAEVAYWNTVKDSGDRKLLESYLTQYPAGRFAVLARIFIARVDSEGAKPPQLPPDLAKEKAPAAAPPATRLASADSGGAGGAATLPAVGPAVGPPAANSGAPAERSAIVGSPQGSAVAARAGDAGAAPAIGPVAALPPASGGLAAPSPSPDLVRNVQTELVRLGCSAGSPDGAWGRKVEARSRPSRVIPRSSSPRSIRPRPFSRRCRAMAAASARSSAAAATRQRAIGAC